MNKIIGSIIVIILIAIGAYFVFFNRGGLKADITGIETPSISMPFESGVQELELDNFNIGASMPSNLFPNISFDLNFGQVGEINLPSVSGETSVEGLPPADWEPDEATCSQFKLAPSCSFVPQEYRDICERCKD